MKLSGRHITSCLAGSEPAQALLSCFAGVRSLKDLLVQGVN